MGVISNMHLLSAIFLIVHYGTVFADRTCFKGAFESYECPDEMTCCDFGRCCFSDKDYSIPESMFSLFTTALITFGIISCLCILCSACCGRRQNGVIYSTGTRTVVQLPPSLPQGYYPGYPPVQQPYPTNEGGYNPYYGPPPAYQATVSNPVSNPHMVPVVPVASAPPTDK